MPDTLPTDANAGNPPQHILGYPIRSHTHIYVSYLIPCALELFVYIAQIVADCAVSYEHFHNHQPAYGWGTLSLIFVPPVFTFILVLCSKEQWANPKYPTRCNFVTHHLLQMLLFPLFAVHRFMRRVFWAVEALFHDDDDAERMRYLAKAEECSTCELYHLIQAYGQSAPQIILQLYHMLTQDLFRNFETTNVQAISLVFSAIDIAAITTTYQRFESQRQAGRHYPWSPPQEVEAHRQMLEQNRRLREECEQKARYSQRTIASFPESEKIMENFKRNTSKDSNRLDENGLSQTQTHSVQVHGVDEVDVDAENEETAATEATVLLHNDNENNTTTRITTPKATGAKAPHNATDDDKIRISPRLRLSSIREEIRNADEIEVLDTVPDTPAPIPPSQTSPDRHTATPELRRDTSFNSDGSSTRNKRASRTVSQLETFKDMLLMNAQLYIKEHVPHPPKSFIKRVDETEKEELLSKRTSLAVSPTTPQSSQDVVDFFLPRPTKIVNGIQQDDFAGKTIAFFGWIAFVTMRMLSLATFCVFFPSAFFILISVHYVIMLAALFLETRFKGHLNRTLFYMMLGYVFIFVLVEFRIKFKRIQLWFVGYFLLTMGENIGMTMFWYAREEFESWWFGFIFQGIIYSGILFVATLLVYYYILKPKDVTLLLEDDEKNTNKNPS